MIQKSVFHFNIEYVPFLKAQQLFVIGAIRNDSLKWKYIIVFLIFKVDLQRLKAALELSVQDILVEVGAETGCNFTAESSATISELVLEKSLRSAGDLQAFATHAKRQSVTAEDVKLLTRRNPELVSLFSQP